jgi:hypothetical protein
VVLGAGVALHRRKLERYGANGMPILMLEKELRSSDDRTMPLRRAFVLNFVHTMKKKRWGGVAGLMRFLLTTTGPEHDIGPHNQSARTTRRRDQGTCEQNPTGSSKPLQSWGSLRSN